MTTVYENEEYRCSRCGKMYEYNDIRTEWLCPECNIPIGIKSTINGKNSCDIRIKPGQLKQGALFRLYGDMVFEVLNCELSYSKKNIYRIALKNYRVVEKNKDEYIEIINGGVVLNY